MEHTFEHQGALAAAHRVKVKPLLQVGRQLLEIRLALVNAGGDRIGQLSQSRRVDGHGLFPSRIEQGHAVFSRRIRRILSHGLLVKHLRAFLAADLRQAELRQRQRFAHPQFGGIGRPCRAIRDRQRRIQLVGSRSGGRVGINVIDRKKLTRASRITKKWQNRAHRRLRGLAGRSRNEKSILAGVIELHRQGRQIRPRLRRRRCTLGQHITGAIGDADDRSIAADAGAADGHSRHQSTGAGDGDRRPARGRTQQLWIAVWPAMNPREALAILKGEAGVGWICAETRVAGSIHRTEDFKILGRTRHACARHRQRQQRQWIGFHQQSSCRRGVVEAEGRIAAHHLIGAHRWPLVCRAGVGYQNIGLRRVTRA